MQLYERIALLCGYIYHPLALLATWYPKITAHPCYFGTWVSFDHADLDTVDVIRTYNGVHLVLLVMLLIAFKVDQYVRGKVKYDNWERQCSFANVILYISCYVILVLHFSVTLGFSGFFVAIFAETSDCLVENSLLLALAIVSFTVPILSYAFLLVSSCFCYRNRQDLNLDYSHIPHLDGA